LSNSGSPPAQPGVYSGEIMSNAVIVSGVRIAVGAFGGSLKDGTVIAMQTFGNLIGHNPCCIF